MRRFLVPALAALSVCLTPVAAQAAPTHVRPNDFVNALVCDNSGNTPPVNCLSSFSGINNIITNWAYNPDSNNQRFDVDYVDACGGHKVDPNYNGGCPSPPGSGLNSHYAGDDIYEIQSVVDPGYCVVGNDSNAPYVTLSLCGMNGTNWINNGLSFINVNRSTSLSNQFYLTGDLSDGGQVCNCNTWIKGPSQWQVVTTSTAAIHVPSSCSLNQHPIRVHIIGLGVTQQKTRMWITSNKCGVPARNWMRCKYPSVHGLAQYRNWHGPTISKVADKHHNPHSDVGCKVINGEMHGTPYRIGFQWKNTKTSTKWNTHSQKPAAPAAVLKFTPSVHYTQICDDESAPNTICMYASRRRLIGAMPGTSHNHQFVSTKIGNVSCAHHTPFSVHRLDCVNVISRGQPIYCIKSRARNAYLAPKPDGEIGFTSKCSKWVSNGVLLINVQSSDAAGDFEVATAAGTGQYITLDPRLGTPSGIQEWHT
jgi:hypothetical protein